MVLHFKMKIVIILLTVFSVQAINPDGPTVVNDFVNCINNLIQTNFVNPGLLIFPHSINTNNSKIVRIRTNVLKRIHDSNKYSVQVTGPDRKAVCNDSNKKFKVVHMDPFEVTAVANYFVIIVDSFQEFTYLARKIIRSRFWNPHGKFLILLYRLTKDDGEYREEVENILSCLFKYNVINVVVLVPQSRNVRNALIYSWKPYDPPKYCGYFNETAKNRLLFENACERGVINSKGNIFKDKLPSHMHGCGLKILALEKQPFVSRYNDDPNLEKTLIKNLLQSLNFSVSFEIIFNEFRGERNEEGVWDGALKELVVRKGQILLGGIFPDFDVHEDFECSSTYLADSYTWVVPRANPAPPWSSLTAAFEKEVWYLATVIFFVCVFTWKILGKLSGDTNYNSTFNHCFINSWIVLYGFSAYVRPNKASLRIFFVFLNIYCVLFMTAYQTKLIIVLRHPTFGYQIKTIQDLVQSGLKYGGSEELRGLFYNSSDPFDSLINDEWIDVHNITKALLDVVVHRNFSVLCSRLELAYLSAELPELIDSFGKNNYYAFEKSTFLVPLEMIGLRGFPFMKNLSHTLNYYKQLGMNDYVRRGFAKSNKRKREKLLLKLNIRRNNISSLSMEHLQGGFFVLGVGMFGGIVILIIEILVNTNFLREKILQLHNLFI
ncbi:glutamate receptor U1-like, partial [Maniola hyperantus]|uniref:glutamate receptor U1-like n=1 Tax=Aphantopus hyperantus TaxID=2795564 RepID=UPI0037496AF2